MKRSRSAQSGFLGLWRRNRLHRTYAAGASAIGVPGCPDWAFSTASIARARIELMLRHATSGDGSASREDDDEGSGRTARVRILSAFRTGSFRVCKPGSAGHRVGTGKIARGAECGKDGKVGKGGKGVHTCGVVILSEAKDLVRAPG